MRAALLIMGLISIASQCHAIAPETPVALRELILTQGVPADAYDRMIRYTQNNQNREFVANTYTCKDQPIDSIKPCYAGERTPSTQKISLKNHRYVAIIDFTKPSSVKRFYLIDMEQGEVQSYHVSHGIGTGNSDIASKFSNTQDSKQTSLGFYIAGTTYVGKYGTSLRMYGLEPSNDAAFTRDIVMHGAWYAKTSFMDKINPKTDKKFDRLGVSWGCPAVDPNVAKKVIPLLLNGGLIYHYQADLADQTDQNSEIGIITATRPTKKPSHLNAIQGPVLNNTGKSSESEQTEL